MRLKFYLIKINSRQLGMALLLLTFTVFQSLAQATDATIQGVITATDNSTLPGATVLIKNTATGFQTGTVTNANGEYRFIQVPLGGPYEITASFVGYGSKKKEGFMVNQGDRKSVV